MRYIWSFLNVIGFAFKTIRRAIITLLVIAMFALNLTMLFWSAGALAVGAAVTALTGVSSVVGDLKKTNDKFVAQRKAKKLAVGKITKRIAKRTKTAALRNIFAAPAEALPIVGATIIVGITALEVKDACDTMGDLAELNQLLEVEEAIEKRTVCGVEVPTTAQVAKGVKESPAAIWEKAQYYLPNTASWQDVTNWVKSIWGKAEK